ncbi:VOC family protein [Hoeflea sp. CAU 1731]
MINVRRLAYAEITTPNPERLAAYYKDVMGLIEVGRQDETIFLATPTGQQAVHVSVGDTAQCTRIGFEVPAETDFQSVGKFLSAQGINSETRTSNSPGIDQKLTFADNKGTAIDIFAEEQFSPSSLSPSSIKPLKLGHLAFQVNDIKKTVKFYEEILGFRVSDWRGDFFVFMRCGPDHHAVNFVTHERQKIHHIAFELKDWAEIQRACDHLGAHDIHLIWGPGRHIIGHNIFIYHRNPDNHIVECYTELDQMKDETLGYWEPRPWHQEFPLRPKVWPVDTLGSYWGGGPRPDFAD